MFEVWKYENIYLCMPHRYISISVISNSRTTSHGKDAIAFAKAGEHSGQRLLQRLQHSVGEIGPRFFLLMFLLYN